MRVFFTNLGCKLNQAEMEGLARQFVAGGHEIAPSLVEADLHVVNSCTVTHAAARDSRKAARRGRRLKADLRTVLTGCYVDGEPRQAAALAGVDLVVPNHHKERLLDLVHEAFGPPPPGMAVPVPYVPLEFGNSRALVKIEDGCNMRCAFCVIPLTRGAQRSRPAAEVVAEVTGLAAGGFAEIVVTGVQISSYRDAGSGLYDLVARLLDETPVARLRLTSIAPWEFDRRLLGLMGSGRLCRHFHLSLQSGSDATLKRMRRPYSTRRYADLVAAIRAEVPGVAITTDVIVGFPGETREEFADSLEFCEEIGFARLHAFPYSARPGTAAAAMPGRVPHAVKRARMAAMLEVARDGEDSFARSQIGRSAEVLWESRQNGYWRGTTDNYLKVTATAAPDAPAAARGLRSIQLASGPGGRLLAVDPGLAPRAAPREDAAGP